MTLPDQDSHASALALQVDYFASRRPIRMQPRDTAYVHRHFDELMSDAQLHPGARVCEWGAGLGRFSRLLLQSGLRVDAIELSPEQTAETAAALAGEAAFRIRQGDVAEVLEQTGERYDAVLGFFMLHHLPMLPRYFRAARRVLKPGGRLVFVEPNPWHPLFPVQITCTPGMRWAAERGIYRLTPGALRKAASEAGFSGLRVRRYGALPRAPYNLLAKAGAERWPEALMPPLLRPFQSIAASA